MLQLENNIAYGNRSGFRVYDSGSTQEQERSRVFDSNIAYGNVTNFHVIEEAGYTAVGNSWQLGITPEIINLDRLREPRVNGQLPDVEFVTEETKTLIGW